MMYVMKFEKGINYYYNITVLSKISWHLTIADLSKGWVIENLDNKIAECVRRWFQLPISYTSSNFVINK